MTSTSTPFKISSWPFIHRHICFCILILFFPPLTFPSNVKSCFGQIEPLLALYCPVLQLFDAFSNVYKLLVLSGVLMCEEVFISKELGETNNKRSLTDCVFNVRQETNTRAYTHKSVSLLNEFHFLKLFRLRKSEFNFID